MPIGMGYNDESKDAAKKAALKAALSGGITGTVLGAGAHLLGGEVPFSRAGLLKEALLGGLTGGGLAGGGTYIGSKLLGTPKEEESNAYLKRSGLGGAILGGLGGAAVGAFGSRYKTAGIPSVAKMYAEKLRTQPLKHALPRGAGLGALIGALPGAYLGSDEGMMLDSLNEELKRKKREQLEAQDGYDGFSAESSY